MAHIEQHTAGSPTDDQVKWTHLRPIDIALYLKTTHQVIVSHSCIKRIVKANNYSRRKPAKTLAIGESVHRKQQFEIVFFSNCPFFRYG